MDLTSFVSFDKKIKEDEDEDDDEEEDDIIDSRFAMKFFSQGEQAAEREINEIMEIYYEILDDDQAIENSVEQWDPEEYDDSPFTADQFKYFQRGYESRASELMSEIIDQDRDDE